MSIYMQVVYGGNKANTDDLGSPIGGLRVPPTPPGERQQNLQNWLNQGFFQLNLRQSYSEWCEWYKNGIFFDVGLSIDPLDPPQVTPRTPLEAGPLAIPADDYLSKLYGNWGQLPKWVLFLVKS